MKKSALAVLALICLTGCEEVNDPAEVDLMKYISISTGISTRVKVDAFEKDDTISVYSYMGATPSTGLVVDNVVNTCEGGDVWTAANPMKWNDGTTEHKFVATYPVTKITDFLAQKVKLTNVATNDLLVATAKGKAGAVVALAFDHVMSQVTANITLDKNYFSAPVPTIQSVKLFSKRVASVNFLEKKATTATDDVTSVDMVSVGDSNYQLITVPQNIASGVKMIEVTLSNNRVLAYTTDTPIELEGKKNQGLKLTIVDDQIQLGAITITPWDTTSKPDISGTVQ